MLEYLLFISHNRDAMHMERKVGCVGLECAGWAGMGLDYWDDGMYEGWKGWNSGNVASTALVSYRLMQAMNARPNGRLTNIYHHKYIIV